MMTRKHTRTPSTSSWPPSPDGAGAIGVFRIHPDGTLSTPTHTPAGTPASGFQGLAAF